MFEFLNLLDIDRAWETIMDIAPTLLMSLREQIHKKGINPNLTRLKAEKSERFNERQRKNKDLKRFVEEELDTFANYVSIPHLFILTDIECVALYIRYPNQMGSSISRIGLQEGVSFAINHLGINGISLAKERQSVVIVRGTEHDIRLFSDWTCLCIPIRPNGKTVGYLDLSFHHAYDVEFAVPLLYEIVGKIEKKLLKENPLMKKEQLFEVFDKFGLSKREKEAAYGWVQNHSVLRISVDMGITEGTVRNLLKSVYRKTNINTKGRFIKMFGVYA